tara:strand:+ start:651 stop:1301 length:651 start_codon:yes stop_codon:yes gene_type:complete
MSKELFLRILSSIFLLPIVYYIVIKGSYFFSIFILLCFLVTIYEWSKISKKIKYSKIGFIFLFLSFLTVYQLIDFKDNNIYFLLIILICISTDIGGYIFGRIFKGPKLTKISPNKTYSGVIGAYVFSFFLTIYIINTPFFFLNIFEVNLNMLLFIFLVSTVSQIGDIIISYFKRLSKIKDTGKIIPGHGGLLDRIDGMIFAFPFSYVLLSINLFNI